MLNIYFGTLEGAIQHPSILFNNTFREEWFEDPFVKHICKAVDNTDVVSAYQMTNPLFGPVNCKILSGGCRNCILAYETDRIIDATLMGDNCAQILVEISQKKDLTIMLKYLMNFSSVPNMEAYIMNAKKYVHSYDEYLDVAIDYV